MKKILSLVCVALLFNACFDNGKSQNSAQEPQFAPMNVSVQEIKLGDIPIALEFDGRIVSDLDVTLKSQVSGVIEEQMFKSGQSVKKGDVLFVIDKIKFQANFDNANAVYKNALLDYNRAASLKSTGAISQKEFDSVAANLQSSKANLDSAKFDLDHTQIRAPFDGVVGDNLQDVGAYVVATNTNLVQISKLDPVYVKFGISDTKKLQIDENLANGSYKQIGSDVLINVGGKEYKGKLVFIDSTIDQNSASVAAKAKFDNPNLKLRPGDYARVKVEGFVQTNGVKIPQSALGQELSNSIVYVVDQNSSVAKKIVQVSSEDGAGAVISGGLDNGDKVILDNFKKIRVGAPVKVNQGKK